MVKIEKKDWLVGAFAQVLYDEDILRSPESNYASLTDKFKDKIRQTQVMKGEILRRLGVYDQFTLVMKYDKTIGWLPTSSLLNRSEVTGFKLPQVERKEPLAFLKEWVGVPYHWGGMTKEGIDCSGLTQLYFFSVFGKLLPKNSRDQRKLGIKSVFSALKEHDLVFCHPKAKPDFHHVAIYYADRFWHARRTGGVVTHTSKEFLDTVVVEEVRTIISG